MYPPIFTNWRQRSSSAVSRDFVILNSAGYFYLMISLTLQLYKWLPVIELSVEDAGKDLDMRPKVSNFDFWYCLHGFILNLVLGTQVIYGVKLWKFKADSHQIKMKPHYHKLLLISMIVFTALTLTFGYQNVSYGWDNVRTLSYCNNLFLLKISMSLIKYIPQVIHNYDRRSLKGFAIQSVLLDVTGGVASLSQLLWQISRDQGFSYMVFVANFGKIGLALVTLVFNFIFISQWLIYQDSTRTRSRQV